jgi:hypothetical protein
MSRDYRGDWIWETSRRAVINFHLREAGRTTVTILDAKGQAVKTIEGETSAALNSVSWDLVPDGPPARAEVYPGARALAKAGPYEVVIRSGAVVLSGCFEVVDPETGPAADKKSQTK